MLFWKSNSSSFPLGPWSIYLISVLEQCQIWTPSHGVCLKSNKAVGYSSTICAAVSPVYLAGRSSLQITGFVARWYWWLCFSDSSVQSAFQHHGCWSVGVRLLVGRHSGGRELIDSLGKSLWCLGQGVSMGSLWSTRCSPFLSLEVFLCGIRYVVGALCSPLYDDTI